MHLIYLITKKEFSDFDFLSNYIRIPEFMSGINTLLESVIDNENINLIMDSIINCILNCDLTDEDKKRILTDLTK